MLCVVVTFGNMQGLSVYARGLETEADAIALRDAARRYGYSNATIRDEEDFKQEVDAKRNSRRDAAKANRRAS